MLLYIVINFIASAIYYFFLFMNAIHTQKVCIRYYIHHFKYIIFKIMQLRKINLSAHVNI
jgi:hypothetical protein